MTDQLPMSDLAQHPGWRWCTAEGSRQFDLESGRSMTFREKLEWLEEMDVLAERFEQARMARLQKSKPVTQSTTSE